MSQSPSQQPEKATWVRAALDRYEGALIRYAASICRDREQARDVVQETFLKLCNQEPADLDGRLRPWLYTVCRNQALDYRRKDARMSTVSERALEERPGQEPDPAAHAETSDRLDRVLQALQAIPTSQQEVIRLRFQNGLSYKEIASVTGHSVSNVGYLMHVGLRALRGRLAPTPTSRS